MTAGAGPQQLARNTAGERLRRNRAAVPLSAVGGDGLDPERQASIDAIQVLDAHHLRRIREIHGEFERTFAPGRRPAVLRHREPLAKMLGEAGALLVAGGHVAVLLNRLRVFDIGALARGKPIVAWSAGLI